MQAHLRLRLWQPLSVPDRKELFATLCPRGRCNLVAALSPEGRRSLFNMLESPQQRQLCADLDLPGHVSLFRALMPYSGRADQRVEYLNASRLKEIREVFTRLMSCDEKMLISLCLKLTAQEQQMFFRELRPQDQRRYFRSVYARFPGRAVHFYRIQTRRGQMRLMAMLDNRDRAILQRLVQEFPVSRREQWSFVKKEKDVHARTVFFRAMHVAHRPDLFQDPESKQPQNRELFSSVLHRRERLKPLRSSC